MIWINKLCELRVATELSLSRPLTEIEELALRDLVYRAADEGISPSIPCDQDLEFARRALLRG